MPKRKHHSSSHIGQDSKNFTSSSRGQEEKYSASNSSEDDVLSSVSHPADNKPSFQPSKISASNSSKDDVLSSVSHPADNKPSFQPSKIPSTDDSDEDIGPKQLPEQQQLTERGYGSQLMPGEGSAIAAFVQRGMRVPRRGEVGHTAEEIEHYEKSGYVMSGSRHHAINAVRIRKENQVYSAEEKRALAQLNFEEKALKEKKLVGDFRKFLENKLQENTEKVNK